MTCQCKDPGGCLNIKMLSYQYSDPHVKDKTVTTLTWESHTWERWSLYWDEAQDMSNYAMDLLLPRSSSQNPSVKIWCIFDNMVANNLVMKGTRASAGIAVT